MTTAREIMSPDPIIVDSDKTARDVAHLLATNGIGMVSQADLARCADDSTVGRLLEAISTADDNTAEG